MFDVLKRSVKVSPWMVEVILGQEQVTIIPDGFIGKPGDIGTFLAATENWETNYSWGWNIVRKSGADYEVMSPDMYKSAQISITFPGAGTYLITATLYDGQAFSSVSNVIGEATAEVTINPEDVPLEIEVTGPDISGPGQPLVQGQEYMFIARTSTPGNLPDNPVYTWGFANEGVLKIPYTNEATWVFERTGNWMVWVDLYDTDTLGKPIQSASIDIEVVAPEEPAHDVLKHLQEMNYFNFYFAISGTLSDGHGRRYSPNLNNRGAEVDWDDVNFYVSWNSNGFSGDANGQVSPDGSRIVQMTLNYNWDLDGDTGWYRIEIADIPLWEDNYNDMFKYDFSHEEVLEYLTSFTTHESFTADLDSEDLKLDIRFAKEPM
jgi:hypothetical protein